MTAARPENVRLSRPVRRLQLLDAARQVFVGRGYHASSMEDIAEVAGVSKPVLYQHFQGKLDLYLALLDEQLAEMVGAVSTALASTTVNRERVEAVVAAFYEFVDSHDSAFRLVFESDLIGDQAVRERVERATADCVGPIADVIAADTGLGPDAAWLLGTALVGQAQVTSRAWLSAGRPVPRDEAVALVARLTWRGIRGFPATGRGGAATAADAG